MKKYVLQLALLVFLALSLNSLSTAANARHKDAAPVRVNFSAGLEGELEPCG